LEQNRPDTQVLEKSFFARHHNKHPFVITVCFIDKPYILYSVNILFTLMHTAFFDDDLYFYDIFIFEFTLPGYDGRTSVFILTPSHF